jgi:hypothetical protein
MDMISRMSMVCFAAGVSVAEGGTAGFSVDSLMADLSINRWPEAFPWVTA